MRNRLLDRAAALVTRRPLSVVLFGLLVTVAAAVSLPGLRVTAGHSELFSKNDVHQRRFQAFLSRFGSPNLLFVLVEGGDPTLRRSFVDSLGQQLPARPVERDPRKPCSPSGAIQQGGCVASVVGRLDLTRLAPLSLLKIPQAQLRKLRAALRPEPTPLRRWIANPSLAGALHAMRSRLTNAASAPGAVTPEQLTQASATFAWLAQAFESIEDRLQGGPPTPLLRLPVSDQRSTSGDSPASTGTDSLGYFASHDGQMLIATVQGVDQSDDPDKIVAWVGYVRHHAQRLALSLSRKCKKPGCDSPLRVTLTGLPALTAVERTGLARDLPLTSGVAAIGIFLLFALAFRSVRQGVLAMLPLLAAVVITLALVRLSIGSLNMLTAAAVPTVLGLGIDFAVHLLARYNEARRQGVQQGEAVRIAMRNAGPGLITGALTTAGAFAALVVNRFKAFAELGLITSVGLLVSLCTTLTITAALLSSQRLRWLSVAPNARLGSDRDARLAEWIVRRRMGVIAASTALAVLAVWQGLGVRWSNSYLALLPEGVPAVAGIEALSRRTQFSAEVAAVQAQSMAELAELTERLRQLPSVGRVEALSDLLPEDMQTRASLLAEVGKLLSEARKSGVDGSVGSLDFATELRSLIDVVEDLRFDAERADQRFSRVLDRPLSAMRSLSAQLTMRDKASTARALSQIENEIAALVRRSARFATAVAVDQDFSRSEALASLLPAPIAARLFSAGSYAAYVRPKESVWRPGVLSRFVDQVRSVRSEATGFAVTYWETNQTIRGGFRDASACALAVLVVLLFFDFRNLRLAALAIAPLAMGIALMLGGMRWFGLSFNVANIIAFPLTVGIGVTSSVHMLHRFQQDAQSGIGLVVRETGTAIVLSAATTMVGFGSLSLALHQGVASLGQVLLIGVSACLLAAVVVLPALLSFGLRSPE